MNSIQLVGLVAGMLTTIAFLPQVIKTWKSRSAKDLSLGMFSLFCLGVAGIWLSSGRHPGDSREFAYPDACVYSFVF
jgi:MtN3 and saliva related transmembrane protein